MKEMQQMQKTKASRQAQADRERSAASTAPSAPPQATTGGAPGAGALFLFLLAGIYFGVVMTKSEAVSWFRIQEMFRFQSFHMYGIIMMAVLVAGVSLQAIKRLGVKSLSGEPITVPPKAWGRGHRYLIGGTMFGLGWGLTGACPGPIFALMGSGIGVALVVLLSALAGSWTYAHLRPKLPH